MHSFWIIFQTNVNLLVNCCFFRMKVAYGKRLNHLLCKIEKSLWSRSSIVYIKLYWESESISLSLSPCLILIWQIKRYQQFHFTLYSFTLICVWRILSGHKLLSHSIPPCGYKKMRQWLYLSTKHIITRQHWLALAKCKQSTIL